MGEQTVIYIERVLAVLQCRVRSCLGVDGRGPFRLKGRAGHPFLYAGASGRHLVWLVKPKGIHLNPLWWLVFVFAYGCAHRVMQGRFWFIPLCLFYLHASAACIIKCKTLASDHVFGAFGSFPFQGTCARNFWVEGKALRVLISLGFFLISLLLQFIKT